MSSIGAAAVRGARRPLAAAVTRGAPPGAATAQLRGPGRRHAPKDVGRDTTRAPALGAPPPASQPASQPPPQLASAARAYRATSAALHAEARAALSHALPAAPGVSAAGRCEALACQHVALLGRACAAGGAVPFAAAEADALFAPFLDAASAWLSRTLVVALLDLGVALGAPRAVALLAVAAPQLDASDDRVAGKSREALVAALLKAAALEEDGGARGAPQLRASDPRSGGGAAGGLFVGALAAQRALPAFGSLIATADALHARGPHRCEALSLPPLAQASAQASASAQALLGRAVDEDAYEALGVVVRFVLQPPAAAPGIRPHSSAAPDPPPGVGSHLDRLLLAQRVAVRYLAVPGAGDAFRVLWRGSLQLAVLYADARAVHGRGAAALAGMLQHAGAPPAPGARAPRRELPAVVQSAFASLAAARLELRPEALRPWLVAGAGAEVGARHEHADAAPRPIVGPRVSSWINGGDDAQIAVNSRALTLLKKVLLRDALCTAASVRRAPHPPAEVAAAGAARANADAGAAAADVAAAAAADAAAARGTRAASRLALLGGCASAVFAEMHRHGVTSGRDTVRAYVRVVLSAGQPHLVAAALRRTTAPLSLHYRPTEALAALVLGALHAALDECGSSEPRGAHEDDGADEGEAPAAPPCAATVVPAALIALASLTAVGVQPSPHLLDLLSAHATRLWAAAQRVVHCPTCAGGARGGGGAGGASDRISSSSSSDSAPTYAADTAMRAAAVRALYLRASGGAPAESARQRASQRPRPWDSATPRAATPAPALATGAWVSAAAPPSAAAATEGTWLVDDDAAIPPSPDCADALALSDWTGLAWACAPSQQLALFDAAGVLPSVPAPTVVALLASCVDARCQREAWAVWRYAHTRGLTGRDLPQRVLAGLRLMTLKPTHQRWERA